MHQPVPTPADLGTHLHIGVTGALLGQVTRLAHVDNCERHVVGGTVVLPDPLLTLVRIVLVEQRVLRLRIGVAAGRVDRLAAAARQVAARDAQLGPERGHGRAIDGHQPDMPDLG